MAERNLAYLHSFKSTGLFEIGEDFVIGGNFKLTKYITTTLSKNSILQIWIK